MELTFSRLDWRNHGLCLYADAHQRREGGEEVDGIFQLKYAMTSWTIKRLVIVSFYAFLGFTTPTLRGDLLLYRPDNIIFVLLHIFFFFFFPGLLRNVMFNFGVVTTSILFQLLDGHICTYLLEPIARAQVE